MEFREGIHSQYECGEEPTLSEKGAHGFRGERGFPRNRSFQVKHFEAIHPQKRLFCPMQPFLERCHPGVTLFERGNSRWNDAHFFQPRPFANEHGRQKVAHV